MNLAWTLRGLLPALLVLDVSAAHAAEEPIRVGILHSQSGTMAISESVLKDTVLMLIADQNRKGGLLGGKLEPVLALLQLLGAVRPNRDRAQAEEVLPLVAEIHRGGEIGLHAIVARSVGKTDALETDQRRAVTAGLRAFARQSPKLPAVALEQRGTIANFRHTSLQPIVAAHEIGGEQRDRIAVHLLRCTLLLDAPIVQKQDAPDQTLPDHRVFSGRLQDVADEVQHRRKRVD